MGGSQDVCRRTITLVRLRSLPYHSSAQPITGHAEYSTWKVTLSVNPSLRSVVSTRHRNGMHRSSKPVRPCGQHRPPNSKENTKLKQKLKLVLIPLTFCYGLCALLHGFSLTRRSQTCLSVSANPPVNICLSGEGGGENLEILGSKNVIQSTFATKGLQILEATVQNLVARDLCTAGLGRQFLAISSFQIPISQAPSLQTLHC